MTSCRRNVWNKDSTVDLESWLESNRPSDFTTSEYAWIQIENVNPQSPGYRCPLRDDDDTSSSGSFDSDAYEPALGVVTDAIRGGRGVRSDTKARCVEALQAIARRRGDTVGKWMLFLEPRDADAQWERIARATARGELGCGAKISPTKQQQQQQQDSRSSSNRRRTTRQQPYKDALCCIYTYNFADKRDVQRVLFELQNRMGFVVKSGYKPDFYTHLGIYAGNEWGLPPTLYSAKQVLNWEL